MCMLFIHMALKQTHVFYACHIAMCVFIDLVQKVKATYLFKKVSR